MKKLKIKDGEISVYAGSEGIIFSRRADDGVE